MTDEEIAQMIKEEGIIFIDEDDYLIFLYSFLSDSHCIDCGVDTSRSEYYMVYDHIWEAAFDLNKESERFDKQHYYFLDEVVIKGMLCIGCLERRLGRRLFGEDFPPYPINDDPDRTRSERLAERQGWI